MRKRLIAATFLAAAAPFVLSGCSGSSSTAGAGGGGDQPAATETVAAAVEKGSSTVVADKISVLDGSENSTAGKATAKLAALLTSEFSATADWNKDKTNKYVHDRSTDVFSNVNEILCMIGQSGYVGMTGKGPYKALIDKNLCKGNDDASKAGDSSKGDSSAGDAPSYVTWTVDSQINSSGQLETKVWIHEPAESGGEGGGGEPAKVINAHMVVTKTKDEAPPYGLFRIDFVAYPEGGGSVPMFKGLLETVQDPVTKQVSLRFADKDQSGQFEEAASVTKSSETSGSGRVKMTGGEGTFDANIAFNADYFRRAKADGTGDVCFDRKKFQESAWRYGLYDFDSGNRVNVKSGVPFNTNADGRSGYHGWIGYWGIWVPDNVTLTNPQTVYSKNFTTGNVDTYTIATYGGKLKKHTRNLTTLDAIKNIPFEGYFEGQPPNQTMYRVIWTGTKLQKIASAPQNNTGGPPAWTDISAENSYIDTTQLQFGELNFWSQALGGQVRIKLANCTFNSGKTSCEAPAGTTDVVFYTEDIVYPGDAILSKTLTCYDNCPQATSSAGMSYVNGNPSTYPQVFTPNFAGHTYTMADMMLQDNGSSNWPAKLTTAGQFNNWGFNSGALIDPSATDGGKTYTELLACDWKDPITNQTQICGWKAWSLPVFYTWETGPGNWNKLSIVTNASNEVVAFEPPVKVEYTHTQTTSTAPDYKYNGVKFFLDYNGFGQLHGIPGKCFDMATNQETLDCGGSNKRYVPEFTIQTGSTVKNGSKTYYVKALDIEQRMVKKDPGVCTAAGVTVSSATVTLPDAGTESADPNIGPEPAGDVKVIGGVPTTSATANKAIAKR